MVEVARRPYSLHLMAIIALFLFLGAPALFQYTLGDLAVAGPIDRLENAIATAALSTSVWIIGYLGTYELVKMAGRPKSRPTPFWNQPLNPSRAALHLVASTAIVAYLGSIGLAGAGTRGRALAVVGEYSRAATASSGSIAFYLIHYMLLRAYSLVALLYGTTILAQRGSTRPILRVALMVCIIATAVANNPFASSRMWFATVCFAFLCPFVLARHRTAWAMVLISIGALVLLPSLSDSRNVDTLGELADIFELASPIEYLSRSSDVDSLGMMALCQQWTGLYGHRLGLQLLGAALFWVPRPLWSGKPIETGAMVTGDLGFEFTNLAPPLPAEGLVDFGPIGVLALSAALGATLAKADRLYWDGSRRGVTPRLLDAIYPFWIGCVLHLIRGGLFASLSYVAVFSFWILLMGVRLPKLLLQPSLRGR